jgi:hypothetical protein
LTADVQIIRIIQFIVARNCGIMTPWRSRRPLNRLFGDISVSTPPAPKTSPLPVSPFINVGTVEQPEFINMMMVKSVTVVSKKDEPVEVRLRYATRNADGDGLGYRCTADGTVEVMHYLDFNLQRFFKLSETEYINLDLFESIAPVFEDDEPTGAYELIAPGESPEDNMTLQEEDAVLLCIYLNKFVKQASVPSKRKAKT